jgi:hypothetical protein
MWAGEGFELQVIGCIYVVEVAGGVGGSAAIAEGERGILLQRAHIIIVGGFQVHACWMSQY